MIITRTVKCVIVGDDVETLIGYLKDETSWECDPSGFGYYWKIIEIEGQPYKVCSWDTTSKEDVLRQLSYPQTDVFIICFNIVNPASFENIRKKWIPEIAHYGPIDTPYLIVGTHVHLRGDPRRRSELQCIREKPISNKQGHALAKEIKAANYLECSVQTVEGMKNVFYEATFLAVHARNNKIHAEFSWMRQNSTLLIVTENETGLVDEDKSSHPKNKGKPVSTSETNPVEESSIIHQESPSSSNTKGTQHDLYSYKPSSTTSWDTYGSQQNILRSTGPLSSTLDYSTDGVEPEESLQLDISAILELNSDSVGSSDTEKSFFSDTSGFSFEGKIIAHNDVLAEFSRSISSNSEGNQHDLKQQTSNSNKPDSAESSDTSGFRGEIVIQNDIYVGLGKSTPSSANSRNTEGSEQHILVAAGPSLVISDTSSDVSKYGKETSVLGESEDKAHTKISSSKDSVSDLEVNGSFSKNFKKKLKLGEGAYGKVYHCIDMDTGVGFAVKIGRYETSESERESFRNEIAVLKVLDHPNIVRCYGSHIELDRISIFMELVTGGSVQALIKKCGPLNNELSKSFLIQILRGLSYLHGQNVVHRDLKAANILKTQDGSVKIADFGLAKIVESVKSIHKTSKGRGTPHWMAPEIVKGKCFTDRTDIWGLGVTAFEFLQGNPPFVDIQDTFGAMFQIAMGGTWEKCKEKFPSTVSDDLRDFVMKCVEQNPKDRPSAESLLEHSLFLNT